MNKLFLIKIFIFLVKPLYYLIHKNFFFGLIQKHLIKNFYYKSLKFKIDYDKISIAYASSFLFKTYEYNDRILIEKHISEKNKSIIIGGGIGFIASLNFMKSSNEFLISEILGSHETELLFEILKKNNFGFIDNCFNSFYFKKNV